VAKNNVQLLQRTNKRPPSMNGRRSVSRDDNLKTKKNSVTMSQTFATGFNQQDQQEDANMEETAHSIPESRNILRVRKLSAKRDL